MATMPDLTVRIEYHWSELRERWGLQLGSWRFAVLHAEPRPGRDSTDLAVPCPPDSGDPLGLHELADCYDRLRESANRPPDSGDNLRSAP
jgi:hypothetical protein